MKLIHLFWQTTSVGFNNKGRLLLWVESEKKVNTKDFFPYQLSKNALQAWYQTTVTAAPKIETVTVNLPCNNDNAPLPSPLIANLCDISDTQHASFQPFSLSVIALENPLLILKSLSFIRYYLEEDVQFSGDLLFWLQFSSELTAVIKTDQYIPTLVAAMNKGKTTYFSKWELLSSEFENTINQAEKRMPFSACLGEFATFDKISCLKQFSEVCLNHLITATPYSTKLQKDCADTIIEKCLMPEEVSISKDSWLLWKQWKNNLSYDQFGSPFQLCIRLNSASDQEGDNWSLEVLMQSKQDPSFMVNVSDYFKEKQSKADLYSKLFGNSIERILLLQLGLASRIYPLLEQIFTANMTVPSISLDTQTAYQFLKEDAWSLKACGYRIIIPSWWTAQGRLKAKIKMRAKKSSQSDSDAPTGYFEAKHLINFNYQLAIGGTEISTEEWHLLLESKSELIFFRGQWVEVDINEMEKMKKLIESANNDKEVGTLKDLLMAASDTEAYDVELDDVMEDMLNHLQDKNKIEMRKQPKQLKATLRPYQNRGVSWLGYLEDLGLNPCLADDMGLGKTMQIIALLLDKPKEKTALLIAPTSVVGNWQREIQKFAPSLKAAIHHGSKRKTSEDFKSLVEANDIIITSYGLIRKDKKLFNDTTWSRLIIDEAQNIKNPLAAQTKALCNVPSEFRIALTGTPVENRLLDLWSIFNFLNPGFLGIRSEFKTQFEFPIQRDNNPYKTTVLKKLVEPFILRRLKTDKAIIKDLPDKIEQKVYCELSKEQATLYQSIVDNIEYELANMADKSKRSSLILSSLLRLKQCCNHPAQVLQDNSEFSIDRSVKLQRLAELSKEIIANGESLLIFSQFKEICGSINHLLKTQFGFNTHYLHGGTSRKKREAMITSFQDKNTAPSVFILSLKAGGVGITLTKANHVIHFDRWWNPAVENQATDRAYRIGQEKTVFAYKFITLGTLEERIDNMLEEKQKVADLIVGNDESWLSKLNSKSFIDLIKLKKDVDHFEGND